jgi:hypothetical protein
MRTSRERREREIRKEGRKERKERERKKEGKKEQAWNSRAGMQWECVV